jgi:CheY-like chemotaxis protein
VKKKRILLVEDDPNEAFIDLLEDFEDYEITIARAVSDALSFLYKNNFHAVIMDIIVPAGEDYEKFFNLSEETRGCPGFELIKIIREGTIGKIPVVIFSGLVSSWNFRGRIDRLCNDHIFAVAKPEVDELLEVLSGIQ